MQPKTEKPAGILIKTTLADFPKTVACSFFLPGCNLRCPYCYNAELANGTIPKEAVSKEELYRHLEKRKNVLEGIAISGGEALLSPLLPEIIPYAKSLGYKIKLDTNGTLPEKLEKLIKNPLTKPDFIAMDIKTSPEKYKTLLALPGDKTDFPEKIIKSIKLISEYNAGQREFRTVLVPGLTEMNDIEKIAELLPKDAAWRLSNFLPENCLDSKYNNILPYTENKVEEFIKYAKKIIKDAKLR